MKKITTIVLTDEIQNDRAEIMQSLDGATISHQKIYERGLLAFKDLASLRKLKINLVDNVNNT